MEWNLLSEKKPEVEENGLSDNLIVSDGENVLDNTTYVKDKDWFIYDYNSYSEGDIGWFVIDYVTHWMYLPKPPIVQEKFD